MVSMAAGHIDFWFTSRATLRSMSAIPRKRTWFSTGFVR